MSAMRSQVGRLVKWALASQGFVLTRASIKPGTIGIDVWDDVRRLATAWSYPIDLFFDVGANDGETSSAALRIFMDANVIAFEPHPQTFQKLLARMGRQPRFKAVNLALGIQSGKVEMFEYDGESTINSLAPNAQYAVRFGKEAKRIAVLCTTVDRYCAQEQLDRIDILKVDTEGFDDAVLQGAHSMLEKRAIRFIYVEFNDLQPKAGTVGGALVSIDSLLRPHGYRFVASYNDYIVTEGEWFSVSNALFALPPHAA